MRSLQDMLDGMQVDAAQIPAEVWAKFEDLGQLWLRELMMIDTTNPPGNESLAADWFCAILDQYGQRYDRVESVPGRANVAARLEAPGAAKGHEPLLLTAHVDVVPHDRANWTQDPFGGAVVDGWMYGRGAVDMKYVLVQHMVTFLMLKECKIELKRDVILLALADEEAGCEHGSRFMVDKHPELVEARWGLNEAGGFPIYANGKKKLYLISVAEKGMVWFRIRVPGTPGHGSLVQDDNPVAKAAAIISQLQAGIHPHMATEHAKSFIKGIGNELGALGSVLKLLLSPMLYPWIRKLVSDPEQRNLFRAVLHNTANPTMVDGGTKVNVVPSEVLIQVDGRTLPGQTTEDFLAPVRRILPAGCSIEIFTEGPPYAVPAEGPLWDTMCAVLGQADPGVAIVPYLMNGFSDSKFLGRLGAEIYGFSPVQFPPEVAIIKLFHGHDERIPMLGFRWGMRVHAETVLRFVQMA
jgi:acetylornithine deacetylase/succinyl-diaminopimelate desuccinylase-like protein